MSLSAADIPDSLFILMDVHRPLQMSQRGTFQTGCVRDLLMLLPEIPCVIPQWVLELRLVGHLVTSLHKSSQPAGYYPSVLSHRPASVSGSGH